MNPQTPEWRALVLKDDPEGDFCHWCKKKNNMWDEYGWFYVFPDGKEGECGACCNSCWNGDSGRKHIERYGLGER